MSKGGQNQRGPDRRHKRKNGKWKGRSAENSGGNQKFSGVIAPYNFVDLSPIVFEAASLAGTDHDTPVAGGYCGSLTFDIIARSPLCVGGERTRASQQAAGQVEMFKTPDGDASYAIPGSTLRGMSRNVLEIATFSRMEFIDETRFAQRNLNDTTNYTSKFTTTIGAGNCPMDVPAPAHTPGYYPLSRAGFLSFDPGQSQWHIQPCDFARIEHEELCPVPADREKLTHGKNANGNEVAQKYESWFELREIDTPFVHVKIPPAEWHKHTKRDRKGAVTGTYSLWYNRAKLAQKTDPAAIKGRLVLTGQPNRKKHMEFVFHTPSEELREVGGEVIRPFLEVQTALAGRSDSGGDTAWSWLYQRYQRLKEPIPVFYIENKATGKIESFGLAMLFPLPYQNTTIDLLPGNSHKPEGTSELDWASGIFGSVANSGEQGVKGRVSFSTAKLKDGQQVFSSPEPEGILSTPKASYTPAYLQQKSSETGATARVATYHDQSAQLRGWKRYPVRHGHAQVQEIPQDLKGKKKLQTRLHTVPAGTEFEAKMRFHNLTKEELGALIWSLTFGNEKNYRHAIGTGKPWGFGQIQIRLQELDAISNMIGEAAPAIEECIEAFETIMEELALMYGVESWRNSRQIKLLRNMAKSQVAPKGEGPAGTLQYMELKSGYVASKKKLPDNRYPVLRPYQPGK
ncbi:TIGR03986 family type III CRISPR-associated RAMP protein [Pyruvatibacter mobilis]|uniref:TIGR03986 family type III CRISPR-associated RAMP protein n=1 Tax=Pyruvatibacter mobilis TaxID=1712261 RepID=UPI003C7E5861